MARRIGLSSVELLKPLAPARLELAAAKFRRGQESHCLLSIRSVCRRLDLERTAVSLLLRDKEFVVVDVARKGSKKACPRITEKSLDAFILRRVILKPKGRK